MAVSLFLAFCRVALGLIFALAFAGKFRDRTAFQQTIQRFQLLPHWLSGITAMLLLSAELLVIGGTIVGESLLFPALLLASLLLLLFSGAMASVLFRRLRTSCHCFGTREKTISAADLLRNGGFLGCSLAGLGIFLFGPHSGLQSLSIIAWLLAGGAAVVYVLMWLYVGDILALFK